MKRELKKELKKLNTTFEEVDKIRPTITDDCFKPYYPGEEIAGSTDYKGYILAIVHHLHIDVYEVKVYWRESDKDKYDFHPILTQEIFKTYGSNSFKTLWEVENCLKPIGKLIKNYIEKTG